MSQELSRRTILCGTAALATAPGLPVMAQTDGETKCELGLQLGNWKVQGWIDEIESTDGSFGLRTEHVNVYSASPAMFIRHRSGPTQPAATEATIDPATIEIGLYNTEWTDVARITQPEIDHGKPDLPVAQKSGQGLEAWRWVTVVLKDATQDDQPMLHYQFVHRFDRWEAEPDEDGNTLRERESHALVPRSEAPALIKALRMLTSGKPLQIARGVFDDSTQQWTVLEKRDLPTETLAPLYTRMKDDLARLRQSEPAQGCVQDECYLTTACCVFMGRPDDCIELRSLRSFRDGWLARHPDGPHLVSEYYRVAPALCRAIDRDPQRLRWLYWATIVPCVIAIRLGFNATAFRLYCRMIKTLRDAYPKAV